MNSGRPRIFGLSDLQKMRDKVRRCKIVGTIGPSSSSPDIILDLVNSGLDIARMNFSHGDHAFHSKSIELIRAVSKKTSRTVTILQDLQGPKIRCGLLLADQMELVVGEIYKVEFGIKQTDPAIIPVDYSNITREVKVGEAIIMDDGLIKCEIKSVNNSCIEIEVNLGGILRSRKGINFPQSKLSIPSITEKDNRDLIFGITNKVDAIALSFVQKASDIVQCKSMIKALGADTLVIAKIERLAAIKNIEEIANVADGLMVARGDLGVEVGVENVPMFQRKIIDTAAKYAKPVIIATQMLESMTHNPRASLAEVADVANGVLEGADCVMLSGEVALGSYPVESVKKMVSIINEVEDWRLKRAPRYMSIESENITTNWSKHKSIARAACEAADDMKAKLIVCLTLSGSIATSISRWRPSTPVLAISPRKDVVQRLGVNWGVYGMVNPLFYNTDILLQDLPNLLKSLGLVNKGDYVVITAGIPLTAMLPTNMLKINKIN